MSGKLESLVMFVILFLVIATTHVVVSTSHSENGPRLDAVSDLYDSVKKSEEFDGNFGDSNDIVEIIEKDVIVYKENGSPTAKKTESTHIYRRLHDEGSVEPREDSKLELNDKTEAVTKRNINVRPTTLKTEADSPPSEESDTGTEADSGSSTCISKYDLESSELAKKMRIEIFKAELKEKMRGFPRLKAKRGGHHKMSFRLPDQLNTTLQQSSQSADRYYAKILKLVIPGHEMGRHCIDRRTSRCYKFKFGDKVRSDAESVEMWVPRSQSTQTHYRLYEVRTFGMADVRIKTELTPLRSTFQDEWVKFDVSSHIKTWVEGGKRHLKIAIECETCGRSHFGGHKHTDSLPLLIVKNNQDSSKRLEKRNSNAEPCDPESRCCLLDLYINPNDYNPNLDFTNATMLNIGYCHGHCTVVSQNNTHAEVKETARLNSTVMAMELRMKLKPCCVPVMYDSYTVQTNAGRDYDKIVVLQDMIATRCGCV